MRHLPSKCWKALIVMLVLTALATMVGCQGFSAAKAASQSTPNSPLPADLNSSPASLGFGTVQIGTTQTQSGTLNNGGSSNATISAVTASGKGFSIVGLSTPLTLTPGQTAPFSVIFAPQSSGSFSGSLAITSDASNPSLNIALSGSGTQSPVSGQLAVAPATINIGNVMVGTSGSQVGTLSATGASVSVSSVDIGSSEFSISGVSFPLTVPAGQSVNFTMTFTPQASGLASVGVSFGGDASNSPTAATVTGTGVAAPAHSVNLSWNASASPDVVGYNVYRRAGTTGSYSQINTGLDANTTYLDTSVTDGLTYYYETTAVNSSNEESARSVSVQAVIPAP